MKTIVLGAGMAGITCAKVLQEAGHDVEVFDKARGPSGRMSSKRSDVGTFDHGAPLFRVRDEAFQRTVEEWISSGIVKPWTPKWSGDLTLAEFNWYTAVPRMSALLRHLSSELQCHWQERATRLEKLDEGWRVEFESGKSVEGNQVVCTLPAPQASELTASSLPLLSQTLSSIPFHGTWTCLFEYENPLNVEWDIHREGSDCSGPIHTIVRESSKPERAEGERVVVHALDTWSDEHIELKREEVLDLIRAAMIQFLGELPNETFALAHRWRYAHSSKPWVKTHHWQDNFGIAGDWCLGAGVGAAWTSGHNLAQEITSRVMNT